jgi:hypothetical protein
LRALVRIVLAACLALAPALAHAQDSASSDDDEGASDACAPGDLDLSQADAFGQSDDAPAAAVADGGDTVAMPGLAAPNVAGGSARARSEAEQAVRAQIAEDGVHVVHFWAPWCPNSVGEMEAGWSDLVARHPEVTFTFVTIRNEGASARAVMDAHDLPARVTELTLPGARDAKRRLFLGLPVTWIPTTWIFHHNGDLAFALNYGEMPMRTLDTLLDATQREW